MPNHQTHAHTMSKRCRISMAPLTAHVCLDQQSSVCCGSSCWAWKQAYPLLTQGVDIMLCYTGNMPHARLHTTANTHFLYLISHCNHYRSETKQTTTYPRYVPQLEFVYPVQYRHSSCFPRIDDSASTGECPVDQPAHTDSPPMWVPGI